MTGGRLVDKLCIRVKVPLTANHTRLTYNLTIIRRGTHSAYIILTQSLYIVYVYITGLYLGSTEVISLTVPVWCLGDSPCTTVRREAVAGVVYCSLCAKNEFVSGGSAYLCSIIFWSVFLVKTHFSKVTQTLCSCFARLSTFILRSQPVDHRKKKDFTHVIVINASQTGHEMSDS